MLSRILAAVPQRYPANPPPDDDSDLEDVKEDKIVIPVSAKVKKKAQAKAQQQGRSLAAIIRAWVMGWSDDEFPDPPNISEGVKAAPKRKKAASSKTKPK